MLRFENKNEYSIGTELMQLRKKLEDDSVAGQLYQEAILRNTSVPVETMNHLLNSLDEEMSYFWNTEEKAFAFLLSTELLGDAIPSQKQYNTIVDCISKLDIDKFKSNPYLKDIDLSDINISKNDVEFTNLSYDAYEIQQAGTIIRDNKFKTVLPVGFFDEKVTFPALSQNDEVWMSITPSEINTMQPHLPFMKGKVITFGLGLGYFAYMSALKDDVESVTIVEQNQDIIDIFEQYILPQFKESAKNKINIIKGDARELFLDTEFMNNYNICFIDIWKDRYDGIPLYNFFKENEKKLKCKVRYWIEEDFISVYQEAMYLYILLNFKPIGAQNPSLYDKNNLYYSFFKKINNYFKNKKYVIKDKTYIYKLIFDKQIMNKIIQMPLDDLNAD